MNNSGDAAEKIVNISLQGFEVAARITGRGAERIGALLLAVMKDKQKNKGKTRLNNMLKSGKELKVFSIKKSELKIFKNEAKRYGVLYSALIDKKDKDGIVDIMVRGEDAAKINRIVTRFNLSSYDEARIRSEIQKTRESKNKKKQVEQRLKEELEKNPIIDDSSNPHSALTGKSPPSKHSLETLETSEKGSVSKPSVRKKLENAKNEVRLREEKRFKSEVKKEKRKAKNR